MLRGLFFRPAFFQSFASIQFMTPIFRLSLENGRLFLLIGNKGYFSAVFNENIGNVEEEHRLCNNVWQCRYAA